MIVLVSFSESVVSLMSRYATYDTPNDSFALSVTSVYVPSNLT